MQVAMTIGYDTYTCEMTGAELEMLNALSKKLRQASKRYNEDVREYQWRYTGDKVGHNFWLTILPNEPFPFVLEEQSA